MSDPFADVRLTKAGFSIPNLKWRELVFIGALRPEGRFFVRDPARPLPPFAHPHLFKEGIRYAVRVEQDRVHLEEEAVEVP